jgi:hypothetical protein
MMTTRIAEVEIAAFQAAQIHSATHHVVERDRRIDDRVPRALHVHPRERRVHGLEARREHRALAHHPGAEERDVLHALHLGE